MHQDNKPEPKTLQRRVALKRLSHITLGTITALVTATGSYQKPTLQKMMGLPMAAAEAASNPSNPDLPI